MTEQRLKAAFMSAICYYRLPAAIAEVNHGSGIAKKMALREIRDIANNAFQAGITAAEAEELCKELQGSADYVINDFKVYWSHLSDNKPWTKSYYDKLVEEFSVGTGGMSILTNAVVLDVGCGNCVGSTIFAGSPENKNSMEYIGIDKRLPEPFVPRKELEDKFKSFSTMKMDFFNIRRSMSEGMRHRITSVLMCNFMHLFSYEEYPKIKAHILSELPNALEVFVVEPEEGSPISILFDFHMIKHCGGRIFQPILFMPSCEQVSLGRLFTLYSFRIHR